MSARAESEECDPVQTAPQSPSGPLYQSCMYTKNHVSTFIAAFLFLSLLNPLSSAHPALKGTNSRPLFFFHFQRRQSIKSATATAEQQANQYKQMVSTANARQCFKVSTFVFQS